MKKYILGNMNIKSRLQKIEESIPENVTLVAVSKTKPIEDLQEAYDAGIRIFGENKVQEMCHKQEVLPKDIAWHMIGHLQSNKVKYIAPFVSLIHSVDSFKILSTINKEAKKCDRVIDVLLQMHIAEEETKFGLTPKEVEEILSSDQFKALEHVRVVGLMGMATNSSDQEKVKQEFSTLHDIFGHLEKTFFPNLSYFNTISMGMSSDYPLAIECGSTMVRIGSTIFGQRNYH